MPLMPTTPPRAAQATMRSSGMLRGWSASARGFECEKMTGVGDASIASREVRYPVCEQQATTPCAARGGVVGINGIGLFLGDNDASPRRMARAAAYVADLVGPQHVGIGLDFMHDSSEIDATIAAHPEQFPPELGYGTGMAFMAPEQLPELAQELRALGMSAEDTAGVMGGNWLRVARQVWKR